MTVEGDGSEQTLQSGVRPGSGCPSSQPRDPERRLTRADVSRRTMGPSCPSAVVPSSRRALRRAVARRDSGRTNRRRRCWPTASVAHREPRWARTSRSQAADHRAAARHDDPHDGPRRAGLAVDPADAHHARRRHARRRRRQRHQHVRGSRHRRQDATHPEPAARHGSDRPRQRPRLRCRAGSGRVRRALGRRQSARRPCSPCRRRPSTSASTRCG